MDLNVLALGVTSLAGVALCHVLWREIRAAKKKIELERKENFIRHEMARLDRLEDEITRQNDSKDEAIFSLMEILASKQEKVVERELAVRRREREVYLREQWLHERNVASSPVPPLDVHRRLLRADPNVMFVGGRAAKLLRKIGKIFKKFV
jgi:hypothetical protein